MRSIKAENIALFDTYTGVILAYLYGMFPRPSGLNAHDVVKAVFPDEELWETDIIKSMYGGYSPDDPERPMQTTSLYSHQRDFVKYTINWLLASGFIQKPVPCESINTDGYVLSLSGLEILKSKPDSLDNKSIGARLIEGCNNVGGETAKSLISETVNLFLDIALKASLQ